MSDASREAFEAWSDEVMPVGWPSKRLGSGYVHTVVDDQWETWDAAWQESRKQALEEVAALFPHESAEYFGSTIQEEIEALK
jgi:hypothetical protein